MDSERARKNALAFLDAFAHSTGADRPRPLDYIGISNMQLLGLKLGAGKEALDALSPLQRRDQISAFIWLQVAPLSAVSKGLRRHDRLLRDGSPDDDAFDELIDEVINPWLATIPAEALETALDQLSRLDEIDAASVTATPAPGTKEERPDPN